ncbi:hypothetical protein ASG17_04130 [Brevundimonas sp. Leaf363]|nr:hypothetical protein ASG17_04130 [Brevundimonas sp. Leaf363]
MRMLAALIALSAAMPAVAQAQVYSGLNDPALTAERHRLANERMRIQSDQRAAFAQNQALNARITLMELDARRQSQAVPAQPSYRPLYTPEIERQSREAATVRRETQAASTSQIDRWLDRAPQ